MSTNDIIFSESTYTNAQGERFAAVEVEWFYVSECLGRDHAGDSEDDQILVTALRRCGAPGWVESAEGWIDEKVWGLIGPALD